MSKALNLGIDCPTDYCRRDAEAHKLERLIVVAQVNLACRRPGKGINLLPRATVIREFRPFEGHYTSARSRTPLHRRFDAISRFQRIDRTGGVEGALGAQSGYGVWIDLSHSASSVLSLSRAKSWENK